MTRKETILKLLRKPGSKLTCGEICAKIIKSEKLTGNVAHYLSGSISSILAKMVKEKILMYSTDKGPRGGSVYQMNRQ